MQHHIPRLEFQEAMGSALETELAGSGGYGRS